MKRLCGGSRSFAWNKVTEAEMEEQHKCLEALNHAEAAEESVHLPLPSRKAPDRQGAGWIGLEDC